MGPYHSGMEVLHGSNYSAKPLRVQEGCGQRSQAHGVTSGVVLNKSTSWTLWSMSVPTNSMFYDSRGSSGTIMDAHWHLKLCNKYKNHTLFQHSSKDVQLPMAPAPSISATLKTGGGLSGGQQLSLDRAETQTQPMLLLGSELSQDKVLRVHLSILQRWIPAIKNCQFLFTSRENKATKLRVQQPFSL